MKAGAKKGFAGRDSIDHAPGGHDDVANAVAGALLMAMAKLPRMRMGAIDWAGTRNGRVYYADEEPQHSRIRFVTITEREDLRQRGPL